MNTIRQTGHYSGIPSNCLSVFKLGWVFEVFSVLTARSTRPTPTHRVGDPPGVVLYDTQVWRVGMVVISYHK